MNCTRYIEQIELLDCRECPDPQKYEVASHLDVCPECRQYYDFTREIDKRLKQEFADIEVALEVDSKIRSRLNSLAFELEKKFDRLLKCLVEHSEKDFHSLAPGSFHQPESPYTKKFLLHNPLFKLALSAVPFTDELIGIRESQGPDQIAMGVLYRFDNAKVLMHAFDCRGSLLGHLAENTRASFKNDKLNTLSWRNQSFIFTVTTDHPQLDLSFFHPHS